MQAITTKYHGPTNFKGARISARCDAGRLVMSYPHHVNTSDTHRMAAEALCKRLGWDDNLVEGETHDGRRVFVISPIKPHEGWRNRETWAAWMFFYNDKAHHDRAVNHTRAILGKTSYPEDTIAAWLEDYFDRKAPNLGHTFFADLFATACGRIYWREIAEEIITTAKEGMAPKAPAPTKKRGKK